MKCDLLSEVIRRTIGPFVSFSQPTGGYFLWLELKDRALISAEELLEECLALRPINVKFFAGNYFSTNNGFPFHFRVSFALYDEKEFELAFLLIAQVLEKRLQRQK